ncbi:MAG: CRTAC1 family protein [Phycisphaerae bacterium]
MTSSSGVDFHHHVESNASWYMPDIMGGGLAVFDYDQDDDLDIFFVDAVPQSAGGERAGNRLFRREADGRYTDVTAIAGFSKHLIDDDKEGLSAGPRRAGMGCAIGDVDNDGDQDLYVTNHGPDQLYRNNGDGTFTDVTDASGVANREWSASALFFDFDRDGWLDLYVCNYLQYDPARRCTDDAGAPDYCGPQSFPDVPDRLFRNLGDGTFADVSTLSGITRYAASGLGIALLDADRDSWPDVFVANDADANFLWINQRDGTFAEQAIESGVALNAMGKAEAGMGIGVGDVDRNGALDLLVTHLNDETNTLYVDAASGLFDDRTAAFKLADPRLQFTGFGVALTDFELDSDLDIAIANGAVERRRSPLAREGAWKDYVEPNQLLVYENRAFVEVDRTASASFTSPLEVSRGLVAIDLDDDGDEDLVVTQIGGPARIYRNESARSGHFLKIRAIDPRHQRDAIGARVEVWVGDQIFVGVVSATVGYLSARAPELHFGLGAAEQYGKIHVIWPDGICERFAGGVTDRRIRLMRGTGVACERE